MLVEPLAGIFKRHPFATAMCALLIAGAAGLWSTAASRSAPMRAADGVAAQPMCAAWDQEASRGIADLVFDTGARAEWRLDQALLQLRRARRHCRSGAVQVAYHDYASLLASAAHSRAK